MVFERVPHTRCVRVGILRFLHLSYPHSLNPFIRRPTPAFSTPSPPHSNDTYIVIFIDS